MSSSSRRNRRGSGRLWRERGRATWWASAALVAATAAGVAAVRQAPPVYVEPVTGMRFLGVPGGSFVMGTPPGVAGREAEEVPHRVTLTHAFEMGQYEVTQAEWAAVMGANPSHFQDCGPGCPVERVSFFDIQAFIAALEAKSPGNRFRLPTEAE